MSKENNNFKKVGGLYVPRNTVKDEKNSLKDPKEIKEKLAKPENKVFQGQYDIRKIAHVIMLTTYSLIGAILLSFVLDLKGFQWILLLLPGAGLYVAHVASTYREVLENNVLGRTMFGWCVGWAEKGPAFKVPFFEKFMPTIMEGTDGEATIHTKIFPMELYSEEFEETEKQEAMSSYKISTLEVNRGELMGVGIDAVFWLKIAEYAKTKEERYNAYYKAVFDVGGNFKERLKSISESHTRAVYGLITIEEAIGTEGKNLWEDKRFSDPKNNAEKAFKDAGVGILASKGMVIEALGVPGIVEKATQKKKEDKLLGEGDRKRVKEGVQANLRSLVKDDGYSRELAVQVVAAEEQINSLKDLKNPKLFLGEYPGKIPPSPKEGELSNSKEKQNPLMPKTVFDVSKEDDEEKDEENNEKSNPSETQTKN